MCYSSYWSLKKSMAAGSEPDDIKAVFNQFKHISSGYSLAGAGGGGYAVIILKRSSSYDDLRSIIDRYHESLSSQDDEDDSENILTLHRISVNVNGIHSINIYNNSSSDELPPIESYLI